MNGAQGTDRCISDYCCDAYNACQNQADCFACAFDQKTDKLSMVGKTNPSCFHNIRFQDYLRCVDHRRCFDLDPTTQYCGNGKREGTEKCDGADLGGATCSSVGAFMAGGQLKCATDCTGFDVSGCVKSDSCGNGQREPQTCQKSTGEGPCHATTTAGLTRRTASRMAVAVMGLCKRPSGSVIRGRWRGSTAMFLESRGTRGPRDAMPIRASTRQATAESSGRLARKDLRMCPWVLSPLRYRLARHMTFPASQSPLGRPLN